MTCALCGRENREGAKFCDSCGAGLDATQVKREDGELNAVRSAFAERYLVESLIGRGGMGVVYKARERALDRHVALKIVPEARNSDATFVERFRREARLAARLRHPRIVSVHEVGRMEPFHYFSMDFIDGETLRSVVRRRGALSADDAIAVVTEVCRAIAHAHDRNIIHRDLKPENVMLDGEGDVFVMDFGLARGVEEHRLTQSGAIVGSPMYMSPEQLAGENVDRRTDIYALGLVFYFCMTGEDLFEAPTITGVLAKHSTVSVPEEVRRHTAIPPHLHDVLLGMLAEDRETRAASVRGILERLTLRRAVSGGAAAGAVEIAQDPTIEMPLAEHRAVPVREATSEEATSSAAARRKARLKSLLDEM